MLRIVFKAGDTRYALDAADAIEIVPRVDFRPIPRAPDFIAGVFDFRGAIVPVIDLCARLANAPAARVLSTRVILVRYTDRRGAPQILGLMAEEVTQAERASPEAIRPPPVRSPEAPFLGPLNAGDMLQYITTRDLLAPDIEALLFPEAAP